MKPKSEKLWTDLYLLLAFPCTRSVAKNHFEPCFNLAFCNCHSKKSTHVLNVFELQQICRPYMLIKGNAITRGMGVAKGCHLGIPL